MIDKLEPIPLTGLQESLEALERIVANHPEKERLKPSANLIAASQDLLKGAILTVQNWDEEVQGGIADSKRIKLLRSAIAKATGGK